MKHPDARLAPHSSGAGPFIRWALLWLSLGVWPLSFVASAAARAEDLATAVLLNEDPSNRHGQRHDGSVVWRIDRIQTAGRPDEVVVHADVKIPDPGMNVAVDFRRNADKSLPASHVVEMKFELPPDVAGGEVLSAPGIMMKFTEQARGVPLMAQSVKVTKGLFLVGLSDTSADRERNLQLLKERSWFDVPIVYGNQHRGILAFGKGYHGEDVFHEAMLEWEKSP